MKVTLLPSAPIEPARFYLTTYLVNDVLAVDAGCLGYYATWEEQARVRHVFLTHSHIDHVGSLPVFLENVYEPGAGCVKVYGTEPVLDCLRQDMFNDRIWPDFLRLSLANPPFLELQTIRPGEAVAAAGLTLTPVAVNHPVPTVAYLIEEPGTAVAIVTDTGPTTAVWDLLNAAANLKAVFLELTFPDDMDWLAEIAGHLTPTKFATERKKLRRDIPIYVMHLKPRYHDAVATALDGLKLPRTELAVPGREYEF